MRLRLILLLAVVLATVFTIGPVSAQTPAPVPAIAQVYMVDVAFDPDTATIGGEMQVTWTNTTGEPQETLPFRLYPNAEHYGEGGIAVDSVSVDGNVVEPVIAEDDPTVMEVPLGSAIAPDGSVNVDFLFTTTIPVDSPGSFGMFRGNSVDGSWALVDWYPIVAAWEPGAGWYLDPPSGGGDPTFVTASAWRVTVAHPDSYVLVGTGDEATSERGERVTTFDLPVGREFAMVALPADQVERASLDAGGTDVDIALPAANAIPGLAELLESLVVEALPRYAEWFGTPASGQLDITSVPLDGALGISWSGSVWLDLDPITRDGQLDAAEREGLRFVVYHELAHQWVANVVGTNSNDHAFLTEGLANTVAVALIRDTAGPEAAQRALASWVAGPYRAWVNGGSDAIADSPASELDPNAHGFVVYGKAGLGFEAIRQQIGDDAFREALRILATDDRWKIVAPGDMLAAFERASGEPLDELWRFWFQERGVTVEQIDAIIAGAG